MVRKEGKRPTKTLWIFCEGKTERLYFNKLKFEERIPRLKIKTIEADHSNADGIVNEAVKFKESKDFQEGDIISCVLDRDANTNNQLEKAKSSAEKSDFILAFSNPCFEYWILCHYEYSQSSYEINELIKKINNISGFNYEKNDSELYNKTKDKISNAITNAEKIKRKYANEKVDLISKQSNPLTLVCELINKINEFKD